MTILQEDNYFLSVPAVSVILSHIRHTPLASPTAPRVTITHQSSRNPKQIERTRSKLKRFQHYFAFVSDTIVVVLITIRAVVFTPVTLWKFFLLGTGRQIRWGTSGNCIRIASNLIGQLGRPINLENYCSLPNKDTYSMLGHISNLSKITSPWQKLVTSPEIISLSNVKTYRVPKHTLLTSILSDSI